MSSTTKWKVEYKYVDRMMRFIFKNKKEAAEHISDLPKKIGLVQLYPVQNGTKKT